MQNKLYLLLVFVWLFTACDDDAPVNPSVSSDLFTNGYFILNEGNFGSGNSSLSFIGEDTVMENVFQTQTGRLLGDVAQDLGMAGSKGYVVVNNDNKIESFELTDSSLVYKGAIGGLHLPRRIAVASEEKAYVTNWGTFDGAVPAYLAVLDLQTNTIQDTITIGSYAGSDRMLIAGGKLYVANNFGRTVSVIDVATDKVVRTIEVGDAPSSMVVDGNSLWVLCSGSYGLDFGTPDDDTPAMLFKIDMDTDAVIVEMNVGALGDHPSLMEISSSGELLVSNAGGLYLLQQSASSWPATPLISNVAVYAYSLAVLPSGELLVGDALGFAGPGEVKKYSSTGELLDSQSSFGVGPNDFELLD